MIEVKNLSKSYRKNVNAVDDLSFKIDRNEVVAFLGVNGAGKTTTLRMLTGFLAPTSGEVNINSFSLLEDHMDLKKQIGYLPETPAFYPEMTIEGFLRYMYRIRSYSKENEEERIENSLEKTNLKDHRDHQIGHLSAGYRKRVGISQALVHNPPVLILDEPISELDPVQIIEMRNLILSLKEEHTILVSSHILSEVSQTADRYLFIHKGKLVAEETSSSLKEKNMSLEAMFIQLSQ